MLLDRLGGLTVRDFLDRAKRRPTWCSSTGDHVFGLLRSPRREKIFPFDLIPRPVAGKEWDRLEKGLVQRIRRSTSFSTTSTTISESSRKGHPGGAGAEVEGLSARDAPIPPGKQYLHVVGTDLVRDHWHVSGPGGQRPNPVGVSYVLENRVVMKKVFPQLFSNAGCAGSRTIPQRLREALLSVAPPAAGDSPCVVLLSPGPYNSAYFEHSFLARNMGIELVLGQDLFCTTTRSFSRRRGGHSASMSSIAGSTTTFSIPRRSGRIACSGVPGLMRAYRAGQCHAGQRRRHRGRRRQGDLSLRRGHDPLLSVRGADPEQRADLHLRPPAGPGDVLDHLDELVVKAVNESGGYGMLMGPSSHGAAARGVPRQDPGQAAQLHRPAGRHPVHLPHLDRRGPGPAARRSAALYRQRQVDLGAARRLDAARPWSRARWWSIPARAAAARTPG